MPSVLPAGRSLLDGILVLIADPAAWVALVTLIVMEVVLGIDNLIFISLKPSAAVRGRSASAWP
jgi:hypothetical protein